MSIVNAFSGADVGWVAVDTETSLFGGHRYEGSKLLPLAHINAVLAFRGSVLFSAALAARALSTCCSFDELAIRMSGIVLEASDFAAQVAAQQALSVEFAGCGEVILMGHSARLSKIALHLWQRADLGKRVTTHADIGSVIAPKIEADTLGFDLMDSRSFCGDRENIKTLMSQQVRALRETGGVDVAAGGRLIYAEIRHGAMIIETIMDFPGR